MEVKGWGEKEILRGQSWQRVDGIPRQSCLLTLGVGLVYSTFMRTQAQDDARREQLLHELMSDLNDLVCSGDMTSEQANEWYSAKADQWREGSQG